MSSQYFIRSVRPYLVDAENLPEELQLCLLKFALDGNCYNNFYEIKKSFSCLKTTKCNIYNLCGTFIELVKLCQRLKPRDFQDTLQEYGVGLKFIENILKTVQSLSVECTIPNQNGDISEIKWKIDLSLLESFCPSRIIIHFCIELTDGRSIVFSMDQKIFHLLRYNITLITKQLLKLQQSNILKIK